MADGGSACRTRRIPSVLSGTGRGPLSRAGCLLCSLVLGAARSVARDPRVLRAQPGAAVKQFACRVEVPGMDCGLGDDVQDDLPHVAEPPAAEVVRPSGRRRIQAEPARTTSEAAVSCRYRSSTASAGSSGDGCQPVSSFRSRASPAATARNQNRSSSTARCRTRARHDQPDGSTGCRSFSSDRPFRTPST